MRHNYTGDQGDYAKFALLNALAEHTQQVVGVNWYLTVHPEANADGAVRPHLEKPGDWAELDSQLLERLVESLAAWDEDTRRVEVLHHPSLLRAETIFFKEPLPTGEVAVGDRPAARQAWHQRALAAMAPASIVFLDPDNGFEVKSCTPASKWRCKYATYAEVGDYLARGQAVVPYQHARRVAWPVLVAQLTDEMRAAGLAMAAPGFIAFGDRGFFLMHRDAERVAQMTDAALALQARLAEAKWKKLRVTVIDPRTA